MAKIRQFIEGKRNVKAPQTEVDGYTQKITAPDGVVYLYLYNYAQGGPNPGDTPTQSLHFDARAAAAFKVILEETFGPL